MPTVFPIMAPVCGSGNLQFRMLKAGRGFKEIHHMGKNAQPHGNAVIYKSISYICCYEEAGMIETEPGVYSRDYQFFLCSTHMEQEELV